MAEEMSASECPLCGGSTARVLTQQLRRGKGVVFHCESCDHGFLISDATIDLANYYSEQYRKEVSHKASGEATTPRELYDVYSKYQNERLHLIDPYLSASTTLLEVGASAGQFLVHVKDRVALADAIELDESCCEFMTSQLGIRADSALLGESRFTGQKYDVVCSFQVMEHVESPVVFLRELRESMNELGEAFIEVPNLRDALLSVWGIQAYEAFYYHSAHLHYFTEQSLRRVAHAAGFPPSHVRVEFMQDYNLLNHLHWVMNRAPQVTCDVGLSPIDLGGDHEQIAGWLSQRISELNREYVARLVEAKVTSNLMLIVSNAS
jgi:2-polyprenyl-3-methyl-5-hydroxy-6-metoxy-1,4-benzoquinol methylase